MAITQALATSFKVEILNGLHAFSTSVVRGGTTRDTFKLALYISATMDAATTAYTVTNEVASGDYTTAGKDVGAPASVPQSTGAETTAWLSLTNTTWSAATISADGAMLYNSTATGNNMVFLLDFGSTKASSAGDFTIQWPTGDSTTGIIRIA